MLPKIFRIVLPWLGSVLLGAWGVLKLLLDWIGRSTTVEDAEQLLLEKLPTWAEWLFSTPWWVPALCAVILTIWLIWIARNSSVASLQNDDTKTLDFSGSPEVTRLKLQFFDGNQIPKKLDHANVYHWYVHGNFTYHPTNEEKKYFGMWRVTIFLVFAKDMPVGTFDIDCTNCELPPYHIVQYSMRHAILSFNNIMNNATLTITINKAEAKPYRI